jgi:hypothetical protein
MLLHYFKRFVITAFPVNDIIIIIIIIIIVEPLCYKLEGRRFESRMS